MIKSRGSLLKLTKLLESKFTIFKKSSNLSTLIMLLTSKANTKFFKNCDDFVQPNKLARVVYSLMIIQLLKMIFIMYLKTQ